MIDVDAALHCEWQQLFFELLFAVDQFAERYAAPVLDDGINEESGAAAEVDAHVGTSLSWTSEISADAVVNRYLAARAFQRADGIETLKTGEALKEIGSLALPAMKSP